MPTENEEKMDRFTFNISPELNEKMRDTAMILGIRPTDLCNRAVTKYIDAIEKAAGEDFAIARSAMERVRKLG